MGSTLRRLSSRSANSRGAEYFPAYQIGIFSRIPNVGIKFNYWISHEHFFGFSQDGLKKNHEERVAFSRLVS
jgi:hypothetical protein